MLDRLLPPSVTARLDARTELACAALVLVASGPLLLGRCDVGHDVLPYALPHLDALQRELQAGRLRTWDLSLFCGYHAHGAGQAGSLYPPNLLLLALLPLLLAYKASVLLHQWLLVRGLLALVVELGGSRRAGLLAGGALLLSGSVATHAWHHNVVVALGWTGVGLWLAARTARRPGWTSPLLLAGACGVALLQAHPQWLAYLGLAALTLAPLVAPRGARAAAAGKVAGAFAAAGLLAAGLLWPMLGYQQVYPRPHVGGSWEFLAGGGARLADVPAWLLGGAQPDPERVLLPGAAVLALAAVRALGAPLDGPARAGLALVAVGLFLAPGAGNPLYPLLVHLPPFSLFRMPVRVLLLTELGLVLLAAGGLDLLLRRASDGVSRRLVVGLNAGGLVLLAAAAATVVPSRASVALAALGLLSVVALGRARPDLRRLAAAAVLAATLLELGHAWRLTVPLGPDDVVSARPALAEPILRSANRRVLDLASDRGLDRVTAQRRLRRNTGARFGLEYFSGFESAVPIVQEVLMAELQRAPPRELVARAGALSIGWLVVDAPLEHPDLRLAGQDQGALLYEHLAARPPCYVERPGAAPVPARLTVLAPTRLRAEATLDAPGQLVVAYAWFPGWVARRGDEELPLELGDDRLFLRVDLPAGAHAVDLTFEDPDVSSGLRLSLAAWLAWAAALVLARRSTQRA